MKILNLTQHAAATEQVAGGVIEPANKAEVSALLTFDAAPSVAEMTERARALAELARGAGAEAAMIGGAPFFMSTLEGALKNAGVRPLYAFSRRESVDQPQPDGSVRKVAVFKHVGFVEV